MAGEGGNGSTNEMDRGMGGEEDEDKRWTGHDWMNVCLCMIDVDTLTESL